MILSEKLRESGARSYMTKYGESLEMKSSENEFEFFINNLADFIIVDEDTEMDFLRNKKKDDQGSLPQTVLFCQVGFHIIY
jgi:hypothetical protein